VRTFGIVGMAMSVAMATLYLVRPAIAADLDLTTLPASCVGIVTVQKRECVVETHYRCEQRGENIWRVESYDQNGLRAVEESDLNYNLRQHENASGLVAFHPIEGGSSDIDLSVLLASGAGQYSQTLNFKMLGMTRRITDVATLTVMNETREIDRIPLVGITASIVSGFPPPLGEVRTDQVLYYSSKLGVVVRGESLTKSNGQTIAATEIPVRFDLPGDKGFQSEVPEYDCEQISWLLRNTEGKST
jgi:hypothetical protein